jgi:phosphoglycolate phosphatase-like HAD superfamily hydrolase
MRTVIRVASLLVLLGGLGACEPRATEAVAPPPGAQAEASQKPAGVEALASWNDTASRQRIVAFVESVTTSGSAGFVPEAERIAVFDNDGTLWSEQPLYFQGFFALDRVQKLSQTHPEWKTQEPFKSALAGDLKKLMAGGQAGVIKVLMAAHSDVTAEEFAQAVRDWLATARHPGTGQPFNKMVYQPMLELLGYLRANGFKVYIVSGGGADFMRVFAQEVYGVPPEQVIGTTGDARYELRDGIPTIVKTEKIVLIDDRAGKPVGIYRHIGRRPILAAGNSDGDLELLQYTTIARNADEQRPRLGLLVHHTDAEREFAYDRESSMGKLDNALDEASGRNWVVVDMKNDWSRIYP